MPLNIVESRSSVKVWWYDVDGLFLANTWPILDTVIKINTKGGLWIIEDGILSRERDRIKFEVMQLIVSDGLSLGQLDLDKVRNSFTLKWAGKISVKTRKTDLPDFASDFTDLWLEAIGLPVIKTIISIVKRIASKTPFTWNMTHSSPFGARLKQWDNDVWNLTHVIHKWRKYIAQWDEKKFQDFDIVDYVWKPVLRSSSELSISDIWDQQLAARLNIPLFWLSRDHARDTSFKVFTIVSLIDEYERSEIIFRNTKKLDLWPYIFKVVL